MKKYGFQSLAGLAVAVAFMGLSASAQAGENCGACCDAKKTQASVRQVTGGRGGHTTVAVAAPAKSKAASQTVVASNTVRTGGRDGGGVAKATEPKFQVAPLK